MSKSLLLTSLFVLIFALLAGFLWTSQKEFYSVSVQALIFTGRDNSGGILTKEIEEESAWIGKDLQNKPEEWMIEIGQEEKDEILKFTQEQSEKMNPKKSSEGVVLVEEDEKNNKERLLESLKKSDIRMPLLSRIVPQIINELRYGRAFVVLRGIPVDELGAERSRIFFWSLGQLLGTAGAQDNCDPFNCTNQLLGEVKDIGADPRTSRQYKTNGFIDWHVDTAEVVGLLCLETAPKKFKMVKKKKKKKTATTPPKEEEEEEVEEEEEERGGKSRIISSTSVYNHLLQKLRQEIFKDEENETIREEKVRTFLSKLYEPVFLDTRGSGGVNITSIEPFRFGKRLKTWWNKEYFTSAVRHLKPGSSEMKHYESARDARKVYDDILEEATNKKQETSSSSSSSSTSAADLPLEMNFEKGDIQLLSNNYILHSRTAYKDSDEKQDKENQQKQNKKRHLLRLWLTLNGSEEEETWAGFFSKNFHRAQIIARLIREKVKAKF